jgi:hypothetical protein
MMKILGDLIREAVGGHCSLKYLFYGYTEVVGLLGLLLVESEKSCSREWFRKVYCVFCLLMIKSHGESLLEMLLQVLRYN